MNELIKTFTINPDDRSTLKNEITFNLSENIDQIIIEFTVNNPSWLQIFIKKDNVSVGQSVLTHQQEKRTILVGKELNTTSSTLQSQSSLAGLWSIKYIARTNLPKDIDLKVTVQGVESQNVIKEKENEIDILSNRENNKKGWVKGDFHTHTNLSDGNMSREENLISAKNQKLDFFFTTEHDVIASIWPDDSEVLVFPGVELTSNDLGHCNFLGVSKEIFSEDDYEKMNYEEGMVELIQKNKFNGNMSINHPYLVPWEWNTDVLFDQVTSLELINDPTFSDNIEATKKAFDLWTKLWNKGIKITGIGGSDSHLRPDEYYETEGKPSLIGDPGTFVYVEKLNMSNVLESVKKGHTKISRIGEFHLKSDNKTNILPGQKLNLSIQNFDLILPQNSNEYQIDWVYDGEIIKSDNTSTRSSIQINNIDEEFHWLRADIKDEVEILGTFNPVYWNPKEPEITSLKEVL